MFFHCLSLFRSIILTTKRMFRSKRMQCILFEARFYTLQFPALSKTCSHAILWTKLFKTMSCHSEKCITCLTCRKIKIFIPVRKQTVKECTKERSWKNWHAHKYKLKCWSKNGNYLVWVAIDNWLLLELKLTWILTITLYAHSTIVITI